MSGHDAFCFDHAGQALEEDGSCLRCDYEVLQQRHEAVSGLLYSRAIPLLKRLCAWESHMGGWEAPAWEDAKSFVHQYGELAAAEAPSSPWEDDAVQFPRLLCELQANADDLSLEQVAESMDLTLEEVGSLFDRAVKAWERIKEQE